MDIIGTDDDDILWSGRCSWHRVIAWRWKEAAAFLFLVCAMSGFNLLMVPLDGLGGAVAETWFGWDGWHEAASNPYMFLAMAAAAGWFGGQVAGSLMTHIGRRFYVTREQVFWGNKGELFSAPLSSVSSMQEGLAPDGGTVKLAFSDGRRDLLIAGVPAARNAAAAIREALSNP